MLLAAPSGVGASVEDEEQFLRHVPEMSGLPEWRVMLADLQVAATRWSDTVPGFGLLYALWRAQEWAVRPSRGRGRGPVGLRDLCVHMIPNVDPPLGRGTLCHGFCPKDQAARMTQF